MMTMKFNVGLYRVLRPTPPYHPTAPRGGFGGSTPTSPPDMPPHSPVKDPPLNPPSEPVPEPPPQEIPSPEPRKIPPPPISPINIASSYWL